VAVVGAGIIGMSVAWHLAEAGVDCLVIERRGVGSGATGIQPGGVRTQWSSQLTTRMAQESRDFYRAFDARLSPEVSPSFDPCGYAFVASLPETLAELRRRARLQNGWGVPTVELTPDGLADVVPGLDPTQVAGATYNPDDGYFDRPGAVVHGFEQAARRSGVTVVDGTVQALRGSGTDWTVVLAGEAPVRARQVVVAAGWESAPLLDTAGVDLPVSAEPRYLFYSRPLRPTLVRPLLVFQDEHVAVKHLADGSVLASDLRNGLDGQEDEAGWRRTLTATARRLVPLLEHVRYPVMVRGVYDVTPDAQLVVGPIRQRPGLWAACGMNGRGLMLAPSVGRLVRDGLTTGADLPTDLAPGRFTAGGSGAGERQVI
jgi:sarcosine oxidase subunit beta